MTHTNSSPQSNSGQKQPMIVDEFEIMEQIGAGAFSHVHVAKHLPTGCYCAAKIINLDLMKPEEFVGIMREVSVFMQIDHPNVCNLYRLSLITKDVPVPNPQAQQPDSKSTPSKIQFGTTNKTETQLCFFMEYASRGTLLQYVNSKGGLNEAEAKKLFIQIFNGLNYLHMYHFLVHRDLKLENILIDQEGNMKITDFGLASTSYNNLMHTFVGTPGYQPPEVIIGNEYDEKCDVWSLGVCLYAMVAGRLPFSTQNHDFRTLVNEATKKVFPKTFSPMLVDLLQKMFEVTPSKRPTLIQLQTHPWLKGVEILKNVAPQPILFYKVKSKAQITKFKRKSFKVNTAILEKMKEKIKTEHGLKSDDDDLLAVKISQLQDNLSKGNTDEDTTTYFCLLHFLGEKPQVKIQSPHIGSSKSVDQLNQHMPSTPIISNAKRMTFAENTNYGSYTARPDVNKSKSNPQFPKMLGMKDSGIKNTSSNHDHLRQSRVNKGSVVLQLAATQTVTKHLPNQGARGNQMRSSSSKSGGLLSTPNKILTRPLATKKKPT